jgi:hypothetical protein
VDQAVWEALTGADPAPVASDYVITSDDVKRPFIDPIPPIMEAMAKLPHLD